MPDLITHTAERFQLRIRRCFSGIIKAPMDGLCTREYWALLFGAITHSDYVVELVRQVGGNIL